MSVNKLGIILFSSFLIFATPRGAPAQSNQDHNQLEVTGHMTPEREKALLQGAAAGTTRRGALAPRSSNDVQNQQQPYNTETQQSADAAQGITPESTASSVEDVKQIQQALA